MCFIGFAGFLVEHRAYREVSSYVEEALRRRGAAKSAMKVV
jgi:hypothetical protein